MIVVDASAVLQILIEPAPHPGLALRLSRAPLHAPHLLDVEVHHVLRRSVHSGSLTLDQAIAARADWAGLSVTRYGHVLLADRIWELRDALSAYDASYAALAEVLGAPLVTADRGLSRAPGVRAPVEYYGS